MAREIKFRAWDKKTKTMFYEHSVSICINGNVVFLDTDSEWKNGIDRIELMQYTGLHDKNGKEIYEGDIYTESESVGIIKHDTDSFIIEWIKNKNFFNSTLRYHAEDGIVIGTIYKNHDLLK